MSEQSVYFRFFSPLKRLPPALAHRLSHVDSHARFALCATVVKDGVERIDGIARYDQVPNTDVAEVAVAVVDERQKQGIGSLLLRRLAVAAHRNGIRTFALYVLPDNQGMLGLLRKLGWAHDASAAGGVVEIRFDITDASGRLLPDLELEGDAEPEVAVEVEGSIGIPSVDVEAGASRPGAS